MSAPTLDGVAPLAGSGVDRGLRFRLKPARRSRGFVQGAWWPRTDHLVTELPLLLAALTSRVGHVERVIFDEASWAPTPSHIEFKDRAVALKSSETSTNTVTLIGGGFGRLVMLVVPPCTNPSRAYTAVMTASDPDDVSSTDELLGIGPRQAQERRQAVIAHQRWESNNQAPRRPRAKRSIATSTTGREIRHD
ncbi:DUF5994 family protein [Mycolicibacterium sp.]|uniref:DUF5994 family protein n=1 Tax=Mycolicibacterium sp. TaxID=2320850 RepID=UPI0037CAA311